MSSSIGTLVFKFFFPVFWIGGFGYGTVTLFLTNSPEKWKFLLVLIIGSIFIAVICVSLKTVVIEDDNIIISNFLKRDVISISDISLVKENRFINTHPVYIHFKRETKFGKKVQFMPPPQISFFGSHPVVKQLRTLLKEQRASNKAVAPDRRGRGI